MNRIKQYVEKIDDELCDAMEYAETYIELKAAGDSTTAEKYRTMASDELKHAVYLHDMAMKEIEAVKKIYTAPAEMQKKWDESHAEYIEKHARIKNMIGA